MYTLLFRAVREIRVFFSRQLPFFPRCYVPQHRVNPLSLPGVDFWPWHTKSMTSNKSNIQTTLFWLSKQFHRELLHDTDVQKNIKIGGESKITVKRHSDWFASDRVHLLACALYYHALHFIMSKEIELYKLRLKLFISNKLNLIYQLPNKLTIAGNKLTLNLPTSMIRLSITA